MSTTRTVIGPVAAALGGLGVLGLLLLSLLHFNKVEKNQESILKVLERRTSDRWTGSDHQRFVEKLREKNPGIEIPDK